MTVSLIPQDELTLDLLAEVLAKMYRYYWDARSNITDKPMELVQDASCTDDDQHPG